MLSFMTVWVTRTSKATEANPDVSAPDAIGALDMVDDGGKTEGDASETAEAAGAAAGSDNAARSLIESIGLVDVQPANVGAAEATQRPRPSSQPFSFRSVAFFYGQRSNTATIITHDEDAKERRRAGDASRRAAISYFSFSHNAGSVDKRAQKNAVALQRLIVGPAAISSARPKSPPVSRTQLTKIKSELMQPKSANRLIAKLRELPMPDGPVLGHTESNISAPGVWKKKGTSVPVVTKTNGPIHAVCLEYTDAEVDAKHFSKLTSATAASDYLDKAVSVPSVVSASLESLVPLFNDMHIVDLIAGPDFGLGQPGDGEGILAGAVPTAETIIHGAAQLTPQLMALGFATGKAVSPNHAGVYPPLDRISVITYWWGLEVCLPKPTLKYLDNAVSISHTMINLLTALSLMNEGVREILPFVRYISQFMDFEWNSIKAQDKGRGVVCAATWVMPAAMVPRPWDFPDRPPVGGKQGQPPKGAQAPRTGQGVVEDIQVPPMMLPALVVTPPSVIKKTDPSAT